MRFQAQEVHSCALRDELARLESELARNAAERASASLVSDPTVAIVSLTHKLRGSEQREQQLAHRSDHLHAELMDCVRTRPNLLLNRLTTTWKVCTASTKPRLPQ